MKKCILFVLSMLMTAPLLRAENAGVPSESEDVMLQAFYWDSYNGNASTTKFGRTKWIDLLKDTAAINANFDLVWFPPSAGPTGMVWAIRLANTVIRRAIGDRKPSCRS